MDRRTLTMNWDALGDVEDDDDQFFESTNRLSAVLPLDLDSSGSDDDDEFDDSRMSFASTISSTSTTEFRNYAVAAAAFPMGEYDLWMAQPGSINDRRRRLLQGMGLNSNKDLLQIASSKLNKALSKRLLSRKTDTPPADTSKDNAKANVNPAAKSPSPLEESKQDEQPQAQQQPSPSPLPILLVRSRSDGDIDTTSLNTKLRKEEMIGPISKQRLTRTASGFLAPGVGVSCQYTNTIRVSPSSTAIRRRSSLANNKMNSSNVQLGTFFLIKNLDTGKEFVVKEFNDQGMWNKVSDLQTGKQLTMEEFEKTVGHSPVVKELMRRANHGRNGDDERKLTATNSYFSKSFRNSKRRGVALLKNIKGSMSGLIPDKERDAASLSMTNNNATSQPSAPSVNGEQKSTAKGPTSQWVKARVHGKPFKEFTAVHLCQEIQAHDGSIWAMRFSFDGHYLATAGEDRVIHIWEVQECDVMSMRPGDDMSSVGGTPVHPMASGSISDSRPPLADITPMPSEKRRRGKNSKKKGGIPDYVQVPETVFGLSEMPICTLKGHQDDVLDLSWSRSQLLLSSSMDKTVRLWDIETKNCLKMFAHNDYVTCIQFNPADDDYFISGSLDAKIRIWSIPGRHVVDWTDLHEMVTAVCYSPDGQTAVVGSHKGNCRFYSIIDSKLEQKEQVELRTKKKTQPKKITGFQFSPCNPSEVLVTSADSRIRILDGSNIIHKFRGYRNTSSQFSAEYSPDGKYVISASEDSQVYIWRREEPRNAGAGKTKRLTTTSYEQFPCREVSVAIPWPGSSKLEPPVVEMHSKRNSKRSNPLPPSMNSSPTRDDNAQSKRSPQLPPLPKRSTSLSERALSALAEDSEQPSHSDSSIGQSHSDSSVGASESFASARYDEISATSSNPGSQSWSSSWSWFDVGSHGNNTVQATAWGLVIVTAGLGGEIRTYQNFGLPFKVSRQTNLFRDLT